MKEKNALTIRSCDFFLFQAMNTFIFFCAGLLHSGHCVIRMEHDWHEDKWPHGRQSISESFCRQTLQHFLSLSVSFSSAKLRLPSVQDGEASLQIKGRQWVWTWLLLLSFSFSWLTPNQERRTLPVHRRGLVHWICSPPRTASPFSGEETRTQATSGRVHARGRHWAPRTSGRGHRKSTGHGPQYLDGLPKERH